MVVAPMLNSMHALHYVHALDYHTMHSTDAYP